LIITINFSGKPFIKINLDLEHYFPEVFQEFIVKSEKRAILMTRMALFLVNMTNYALIVMLSLLKW